MLKQGLLTIVDKGEGNYDLEFSAPGYEPLADLSQETIFFFEAVIEAGGVTNGYRNVADVSITSLGDNLYQVIGYSGIANTILVTGLKELSVIATPKWQTDLPPGDIWLAAIAFDVVYNPLEGDARVVAHNKTEYSTTPSKLSGTGLWKSLLIGGAVVAGIIGLVCLIKRK